MFGTYSNFKCPCCEFKGVVDLGRTQFIDIKNKGDHLALRHCPECRKVIAFKMVDRKEEPSISFDLSSIEESDIQYTGVICY